ncbi:hypothetical protein AAIB33_08055 [Microbacterium sp. AZCO]|uniref:hypothetical protein n=1 Tax=Microbacterium sp. AZCO TaxID=3142976 RepID=UPI0031F3A003
MTAAAPTPQGTPEWETENLVLAAFREVVNRAITLSTEEVERQIERSQAAAALRDAEASDGRAYITRLTRAEVVAALERLTDQGVLLSEGGGRARLWTLELFGDETGEADKEEA